MNDLAVHLTDGKDKHLYEQIYEYIRDEIKGGKLLDGEKLPSTRSLAEYLQVSRSTVELAYDQLLSEGYIESIPYKGYYICRAEELYQLCLDPKMAGGIERIFEGRSMPEAAFPVGQSVGWEVQEKKNYEIDFSPNAIDMNAFPFGTWRRITRETLNDDRKELFFLGEPKGDAGLRLTICRYLHSSRGVNASPEQIIVGAGNDYLLLLLQHILGKEICVAFENPSYRRAWRIFSSFAAKTVTVASDGNGMRVDSLREAGADVAYCMPSRQYPTGTVMPIGRRMELLKWAKEAEQRYLIEDDYDSEFRYRGKPIPSLQASDREGRVIYVGTFSKSIAPAIRISFMVLPPKLLVQYEKNCAFFSSTVSRIDQTILDEFIRSGAFERHLNKMRKLYKEKHDLLLEELRPLLTKYRLSGEYAGLHVLLTSCAASEEEALVRMAAQRGVRIYGMEETALSPLEKRYKRHEGRPATLILGYGGLDGKAIREGVRRLREIL